MKIQITILLLAMFACLGCFTGCTSETSPAPVSAPAPAPPPVPKVEGIWRYEGTAVVEAGIILKDNKAVTERIDLRLSSEGTADMKWKHDDRIVDSIVGSWKLQGDLLSITQPDSGFTVFRIVAVDAAELRILTRHGKLYRFTRIAN